MHAASCPCEPFTGKGESKWDGSNPLSLRWERAGVRVALPPPSTSLPPGEGEWVDSRLRGNDSGMEFACHLRPHFPVSF